MTTIVTRAGKGSKLTKAEVDANFTNLQATADGAAQKASNLSDLANAGTARTNLGLGTAATHALTDFATSTQGTKADGALQAASNLSDVASAATARTNLGLGNVATLAKDTDGTLAANSDSNVATQKATKTYVDALKTYVDNLVAGMQWKQPVVAATTTAGTLATDFAAGSVIDGITLSNAQRILIKDQSLAKENGIYVVNVSGAPTRADDASSSQKLISAAVIVEKGTANADLAFVCTSDAVVLGSTAVTFVQFGASVSGALLATNNLSDLSNAATARTNLGLGTVATLASTTDGTLAGNSDSNVATEKAVRTYVAAHGASAAIVAEAAFSSYLSFGAF